MYGTPYAQRQLEGEGEYVTALVKGQVATLWVSVFLAWMCAAISVGIAVVALVAANNNRTPLDGLQGDRGAPGTDGVNGRNGTDGLDGDAGLRGLDGVNGSQVAVELQLDGFRGIKASDVLTMSIYDDTPVFTTSIVVGPINGSSLVVAASGISIGTRTRTANVALEIDSRLGAVRLPSFTSAQRNALSVPVGSVIFDTNLQAVCVFAGTQWYSLTMTAAP